MQATSDVTSDSEVERASKQRFFQQLEADWQASHFGEPIDYALLNHMHSSSIGLESSSTPDKSPAKGSSSQPGVALMTYSILEACTQECAILLELSIAWPTATLTYAFAPHTLSRKAKMLSTTGRCQQ